GRRAGDGRSAAGGAWRGVAPGCRQVPGGREGEGRDQREHVLRQLGLIERQEYERHDHPAREEQGFTGCRVAPSVPGGPPVSYTRECRDYPGKRRERDDGQVVPERCGAVEAPRRDPLERLAEEHIAGEIRMLDR